MSTRLQRTKQPNRVAFFVRWGRYPLIESGSARPSGAAESGSHSPLLCSGRPMVAPTVRRRACEYSRIARNSGIRLQCILTKKMPTEKPEIFSGFLRFLPFSSLFLNSDFSENKKMPIGIFGKGSRSEPFLFHFYGKY